MNTSINPFNEQNKHPRDSHIEFFADPHSYQVDGQEFQSATALIDSYFAPFDSEYWSKYKSEQLGISIEEVKDKWDEIAAAGTQLHARIEQYFIQASQEDSLEFSYFLDFIADHPNLQAYRTEWTIFHEKYGVAGTLDLLAKNEGKFEIYDWKRSKNVISLRGGYLMDRAFRGKTGKGVLQHIPDTNYHKYCLQQSLYRYILEHKYGLEIEAAYLIVLHPKLKSYHKVKATYYPNEIESILEDKTKCNKTW